MHKCFIPERSHNKAYEIKNREVDKLILTLKRHIHTYMCVFLGPKEEEAEGSDDGKILTIAKYEIYSI